MTRESFNNGWTFGPKKSAFDNLQHGTAPRVEVTLPHDAIRDLPRSTDSDQGAHTAYFPGGSFSYEKTFDAPDAWRDKRVSIEFEGVYRDAMVFVNGEFAAQRPHGYTGFTVALDAYLNYGKPNHIAVEARTHQDTRWYSGAGIYRDTHLRVENLAHVAERGVRITTPDIDESRAVVAIEQRLVNDDRHTRTLRVHTVVTDPNGDRAAEHSAPVTVRPGSDATTTVRVVVPAPSLWSPDDPALYVLTTAVWQGETLVDEVDTTFGIRTLQLDPEQGLRINGIPTSLRGACIHHDNGPLGSATLPRAEERRIEILKAAGFNAIRAAHNPLSVAMLDACDRLGMLVMDEYSDVWTENKTGFDYSLAFPEWWERDIEAMVLKDRNHPSVIMYSIGNEIFETGTPLGSEIGRRLARKVRRLDDTRFVTNAINPVVAVLDRFGAAMSAAGEQALDVNTMMADMQGLMAQISGSQEVGDAIEESASVVDVVGLNYADSRYVPDAQRYPHRVVVGSETFPGHIDTLWKLVEENAHVIGDFTWTGWDYLGEVGVGRIDYTDEPGYAPSGITGPYPYLVAAVGDIAITGERRPVSYYRETVFGLRRTPYIAVHRPEFHGRPVAKSPWAWDDVVASWSWSVAAGSPTVVDVYSDADEVELRINGGHAGTAHVGTVKPYIARFEVPYEAGVLTAHAIRGGVRAESAQLRSAHGEHHLHVRADRSKLRAGGSDVAYLEITLEDRDGTVATNRHAAVTVTVSGAGTLAATASAAPRTTHAFANSTVDTQDGRALAIIRAGTVGQIQVTVTAPGLDPIVTNLVVE